MIYLDNHATTRTDPVVAQAMMPWLTESYGNAGSTGHGLGEAAREAVEGARQVVANAIGAAPEEIVFTSGATESNNLAFRGGAPGRRRRGDHLVSVATEHRAVLDPLRRLSQDGCRVSLLGVAPNDDTRAGLLDPERVADALGDDTCLVSVMLANNEVGVIQPVAEIAQVCHDRGVLLHTDATQAVGKLPVDVEQLGVDVMSFTAHKLHGPPGVGALYVRRRQPATRLMPQITGGGQERGRRGGTLNVPGIVGFAKAVELCQAERRDTPLRLGRLRNRLAHRLEELVPGTRLCGPGLDAVGGDSRPLRLPNNLMVTTGDADGEAVQLACPGVAFSTGAACSSADPEPSHVLQAMGLAPDRARTALRFGLSRFTTAAEVDSAAIQVAAAVAEVRRQK